jgi:hypothetical protein
MRRNKEVSGGSAILHRCKTGLEKRKILLNFEEENKIKNC